MTSRINGAHMMGGLSDGQDRGVWASYQNNCILYHSNYLCN